MISVRFVCVCGKLMESLLSDKWDVQHKHAPEEVLQRWRGLCGVVKNHKRRFRFTANLSKRYEAAAMRKTNHVITFIYHLINRFMCESEKQNY